MDGEGKRKDRGKSWRGKRCMYVCVRAYVCVCARVRACLYACVRTCVRERNREDWGGTERKRERRVIKDFSDETSAMREWPNSFTDLRSPYFVLRSHVVSKMRHKDGRSIRSRRSHQRREMDRARVASRYVTGITTHESATMCILTLQKSISTLRLKSEAKRS